MPENDPESGTGKGCLYALGVLIAFVFCIVIPLNLLALTFGLEFNFKWALALAGFVFLIAFINAYLD